ncbi:MAG: leucine-rich repeat protein, partial [Oscillospiraceae bacterium]|nr:leucine-rich repeat protein [Oscillospiraceae bacterium]
MGERVLTREDSKSFIRANTDKLRLPSEYTVIGEGALAGFSQLKELIIPENVTRIEPHAFFIRSFKGTSNLERLTIPATLTSFDLWSFYDCVGLKTINLPDEFPERQAMELFFAVPNATLYFGKKMIFANKTKTVQQIIDETDGVLNSGMAMLLPVTDGTLTIPSKYFAIAPHAFRSIAGKGVKRVVIPASIRICAPYVFSELPELEDVIVENGAVSLDNYMFARCKRLKRVGIPNTVVRVGAGLLMECSSLRGIRLPEQLTAISEEMFSECTSLAAIEFNSQITKIGAGAFNHCLSLKTLALPEGVEKIGTSAFWECSSLQQLYIPPSVKVLSQSSLGNCPSLSVLYMPKIITDPLESKRIFGENTNPTIHFVEPGCERPALGMNEMQPELAGLPMAGAPLQKAQDLAKAPAATPVMQMEEALAQMQQQIAALTQQTAAMQQNTQTQQPTLDAAAIQALNENISAMRSQFQGVVGMQSRVEEIATMQASVQEKIESISGIQQSAEAITGIKDKIDAISDIQEKVNAMSGMQEKVEAITDIQQKVDAMSGMQEKVEAISDIQQKVDAMSGMQEKVEAISDIRQKVEAIPELQQQVSAMTNSQQNVNAISEIQEKVNAISEIQEKVSAISDIQQKVDAISDIQEKVGAISDVREKVGEISDTQADMNKRFEEMTHRPEEAAETEEEFYAFDARMALVPVQRSLYRSDDRVFTHEISKSLPGPKERSAELKQYTVIAARAFLEAEAGERFEIPEGVRRVETQAFWSCPRLMAVEIPNSLTEVEPDAFTGCTRLSDVYLCENFPERRAAEYFMFRPEIKLHWPKKGMFSKPKIVTVGELLEKYDDILTAEKIRKFQVRGHILQIPEGYTIIAPDAAKGIDLRADEPEHVLQTIFLPRSLRRVASRAFTGLETVMHIVVPNGLQIIDMNGFSGCVGPYRLVLPDTVIYIGPYAFAAPSHYEQIRLPKKIRYISESAFANCDSLASLRIATSVKFIGESALAGCNGLNSLVIPKRFSEELQNILNGPVKLNVRWTEDARADYKQEPTHEFMAIAAPEFPPTAEQRLFTLEMSRSSENFSEKLSKLYQHPCVGPYALLDMANQTKFEIPLGVQRLCSNAFGNNSRLLTLTVPKALNEFEYEAFKGCDRLRDIFLPDEFDRFGAGVLFMRKPVVQITFGNSRPVRVRQLIQECPWVLTSADAAELDAIDGTLTVPNGYVVIASYVYHGVMGHTNLKRFLVPPSARLIGSHAFVQMKALEEVLCAEGLQGIESEAFGDCPELKRVVLPSTLKYMGENVFMGCPKLETLVLPKAFADRAEQLRMTNPNLVVQWCEDFAENERPSLLKDYMEMMKSAANVDAELLEACDPYGVPYHRERDDDYATPIETSVLDENAIEGEVYERLEADVIPQLETEGFKELAMNAEETVVEPTAEAIAAVAENLFANEALQEIAAADGAEAPDLATDTAEVIAEAVEAEETVAELDALDGDAAELTAEVEETAEPTEEAPVEVPTEPEAEEALPSLEEITEPAAEVEETAEPIEEAPVEVPTEPEAEEALPSLEEITEPVGEVEVAVEPMNGEAPVEVSTEPEAEEALPSLEEITEPAAEVEVAVEPMNGEAP